MYHYMISMKLLLCLVYYSQQCLQQSETTSIETLPGVDIHVKPERPSVADCVSGLFISLSATPSFTKHDGSLQFVLAVVYSCETVWPPVRVIPLDAMRVIAPQWNRRKWWTWYIWNSASYICMPLRPGGGWAIRSGAGNCLLARHRVGAI